MKSLFSALVVSTLAAIAPIPSFAGSTTQPDGALLQYVAPYQALAGISYGMTAVDNHSLFLGERISTRVASGPRTVWYSCPGEAHDANPHVNFDFEAGQTYELVCRDGQPAEIRAAGC